MAKYELFKQIKICLGHSGYSIDICRNALKDKEYLARLVHSKQVLIVTNKTIAPYYLDGVKEAFSPIQCDEVILEDGENYKNEQSLHSIYDVLIHNKHHRDTTLIALGGGVIGDITGFAASTYQRGVDCVQIPTTLLAQIDASVGGKTAINHPFGKNMIGSFYQPKRVVIDLNTLETLPEKEFRAGLAEMIKYGIIVGGSFYSHLKKELKQGITIKSRLLPEFIAQCCEIKAKIVEEDECESGIRELLNLGHTFAHALEAYTHYERWLHGEAVAIGLFCAAMLSYTMGLLDLTEVKEIENMLIQAGLPHKIPKSIDLKRLIELMHLDKKIRNNALRFVVIKEPGTCFVSNAVSEQCLQETLITAVGGE